MFLKVVVHGLVGAVEHNGKAGTVDSRVGENGRCGVRLPGRATPLGLRRGGTPSTYLL